MDAPKLPFQILSLSGGGYLGLYTIEVLARIEQAIGGRVADRFDLLAGTSIGGILALGLAAGRSAEQIRDTIARLGPRVFGSDPPPQTRLGQLLELRKNPFRAKHRAAALQEAICEVVGVDTLVGDLRHRVIVPAINLTKGSPQVFKTPHHPTFVRDLNLRVVDVALATSAAPTYLPIHRIDGELFCDGGLYANAPDMIALHEAEHFLREEASNLRLLSIGTTTSRFSFSSAGGQDLGWVGWMAGARLTSVMIAAQQLNSDYMLQHRLGDRYLRIDHEQSKEQERQLGLDIATAIARQDLAGLAEASVRKYLPREPLKTMLTHRAPEPQFAPARP
jgi:patatin-like phospholipase/acyl hydrolase